MRKEHDGVYRHSGLKPPRRLPDEFRRRRDLKWVRIGVFRFELVPKNGPSMPESLPSGEPAVSQHNHKITSSDQFEAALHEVQMHIIPEKDG